MRFTNQFIDEISRFENIYCLVSGGYHSTSAALLLKDHGFDNVILLHNRTYLEQPYSLKIIQKIIQDTNYAYNLIEPDLKGKKVKDIIRESFKQIDQIIKIFRKKDKESNRRKTNHRDFITCCRLLKKGPSRKWYTNNLLGKDKSIIISSLCPFESNNRALHLFELRKNNTYIRIHNNFGKVWMGYPFRDAYSDRPFHEYLISKGIIPEHSGCVICPIRVAYMLKKGQYYDGPDLRFYNKISAGNELKLYSKKMITEFMEG